ncbi:MAG: YdeI/OmpD-associated family protein [Candidatus Acidiferrales bacterium]
MSAHLAPHRFLATIYKIWMMRHVDVPPEISEALLNELANSRKGDARGNAGKPKYIPVVAIVNGRSARVTLVPAGGGRFRVQINTALRKAARVDSGDVVGVDLRLDLKSRSLPVPPDLRVELKHYPKAKKAFDELPLGHRRHIIQYFDSTKSPEARQRRLERTIDVLLERAFLQPRRSTRSPRHKSRP